MVVTIPGNTVFSDLRVPIGSMLEIMEAANPYIMPEFGKLMINAADDTNKFEVVINDPTEIAVGSPPTNQAWYLEKIEPTPHLRRVDRVEITGAAKIIKTPIAPLREGKLQNASYSWAETSFDGSKTVIVRTKTAEDKITIRSL